MDCPVCQTPNTDEARFCAKCGAPLPAVSEGGDPLIGAVVGGRFRITSILGEGGMGRVYRGEQQMGSSVRQVAIKTLLAEHSRDPQTVARFMRECGTVSELEHPNTIKVYDFGQTNDGALYIAMELLTGRSLERVLEEERTITPERADWIFGQVCGSLSEAHAKGIVHRDLKPANIQLLTRAGEEDYVKVLDFGIAKKEESKEEQKLTRQGMVLGTPPYMSPEQFQGGELDARSDIYSLGVMAYEVLTGKLPFEAETPWQWATQHMTAQPRPFEDSPHALHAPPRMREAILRALSKRREDRQSNVAEFYQEFTLGSAPRPHTFGHSTGAVLGASPRVSLSTGASNALDDGPVSGSTKTQVGEPLFAPQPGHSLGQAKTVADLSLQDLAASAPSSGGPVVAPPPPAAPPRSAERPRSSKALVLGVGGLLAVGAVIAFVASRKPKEDAYVPVTLGSAAPAAVVEEAAAPSGVPAPEVTATEPPGAAPGAASAGAPARPGSSATVKPGVPGSPSASGATPAPSAPAAPSASASAPAAPAATPAEEQACMSAQRQAGSGNVGGAVAQFRGCKGPKRADALRAIDSTATSEVRRKGCAAKPTAQAAASVGASSAMAALPANCR